MASIRQLPSGNWQVQIRRKCRVAVETFLRKEHAREWAVEVEAMIDRGKAPLGNHMRGVNAFAELIDMHIEDMKSGQEAGGALQDRNPRNAPARAWRPPSQSSGPRETDHVWTNGVPKVLAL